MSTALMSPDIDVYKLSHGAHPPVLEERVNEPQSGFDGVRNSYRSLLTGFGHARTLSWRLFVRDTSADHRQSLLGYFWLVIPAVASSLVWILLNSQKVIKIDSGDIPYPVFVLSGTVIWTAFNTGLMSMLNVFGSARSVLAKVNFPHEALVYAAMLKAGLETVMTSIILLPMVLFFRIPWQPAMLLFPVALFCSFALATSIGLLVMPVAALYSDVSRGIQFVLRFGFFLTPVIYELPKSGFARHIMLLNPATPVVVTGRAWLTGSNEAMPVAFGWVLGSSIVIYFIALVIYKVSMPYLTERIAG